MAQESTQTEVFTPNATMIGVVLLTGSRQLIEQLRGCSFQAKWTGTPTGTFTFEISNDVDPDASTAVAGWTTYSAPASFASGNPTGAAGSFGFEFEPITFKWIRPKYLNSAGAG